jgi:hypothetical protein
MAAVNHRRMIERTVREYRSASEKTRELYKRHSMPFEVPSVPSGTTSGKGLAKLARAIVQRSKLHFNLIYDGSTFSSNSALVHAIPRRRAAAEGRQQYTDICSYVLGESLGSISINVPANGRARLNLLLLCGSSLPLEISVRVGRGASLSLFEWYGSAQGCAGSVATLRAVEADRDSSVEVSVLHSDGVDASVDSVCSVHSLHSSRAVLNNLHLGGRVTRAASITEAEGEGSSVSVNDMIFGGSGQKFDVSSFILNSAPRTSAILRSSCILTGGSSATLKGNAAVAGTAKGSNSRVEARGLLLDPSCKAQLLPDMSVACRDAESASHSASVAPIDDNELFYLMSRGMSPSRARRMFVAGFASGRLAGMGDYMVKEVAMSMMLSKLGSGAKPVVPRISTRDIWVAPAGVRR